MTPDDLNSYLHITLLSLRVAVVACAIILIPGIFFGYITSRGRFLGRSLLEAILLLPIVLPPVAVGLALLSLFAADGPFGHWLLKEFDWSVLLSWWGAVVASAVMAFPLLVLGTKQAFDDVPRSLRDMATTLGKSRSAVFWKVDLPLARSGIIQALLLAFARALGEFGATNLVAGLIPKQTETLALGIYDRITNGRDDQAWALAGISIGICFFALLAQKQLNRRHVVRESQL